MAVPDNIFLIGPMGVGKSTIGRHLAALLAKDFYDSDHEIEHRTGAQVSLIFDVEGEAGFRVRESAVIDELSEKHNIVMATGGGVVLAEANRAHLRSRGYVIYLYADINTLLKRTQHSRNRPLLQAADRRKTLETMMAVRDTLYRQTADVVIETGARPPKALARDIVNQIKAAETL